jgi:hypothetical protein
MLFRGEPLVDPLGASPMSTDAVLLVMACLVIFAMFVLALLVTVLIAASQLDFEQIALNSYWEPKLAFILSAEDFGVAKEDHSDRKNGIEAKLAQSWDIFMLTIFGGELAKVANWYAKPFSSKILAWTTAIFVVPAWIILGIFSLGLLWPPQLRLWLFRPHGIGDEGRNACVAKKQSTASDIRSEIMQIKLMSYERSIEVEKELRELKELLYMAMQE